MSEIVPAEEIEQKVGARRHSHQHLGRAVSAEQRVYILHSQRCLDTGNDLRECPYSEALDRGVDMEDWGDYRDMVVILWPRRGRLLPIVQVPWLKDYLIEGAE